MALHYVIPLHVHVCQTLGPGAVENARIRVIGEGKRGEGEAGGMHEESRQGSYWAGGQSRRRAAKGMVR